MPKTSREIQTAHRAKRTWLDARAALPGYAAYVQAAMDWHQFDTARARAASWAVQSVAERAALPEYQAYCRIKDAFDKAAKALPEYAAYLECNRQRA
jgi:hypothetical protein